MKIPIKVYEEVKPRTIVSGDYEPELEWVEGIPYIVTLVGE